MPLLSVCGLKKSYKKGAHTVPVLKQVDFHIEEGECLGLVGQSGSGKSTLGRCILGLEHVDTGEILFRSQDLLSASQADSQVLRQQIQMVFQDPYASLNPRMTVEDCIAEPLDIHCKLPAAARLSRVLDLLEQVGLEPSHSQRYPHEFSGGQRQRICIARALALQPELLICDEALSALDVSIQAQIVQLLKQLQDKHGLTYLFITHDRDLVHYLCTRVATLHEGRIVLS